MEIMAKPGLPPLNASVDHQYAGAVSRQAGCVTGNGNGNARDGSTTSSGCVAYATNDARARTAYNCVRTFFRVRHIGGSIKASGKL